MMIVPVFFCNAERMNKYARDEDVLEDALKRVEVNDAASIFLLANHYEIGRGGCQEISSLSYEVSFIVGKNIPVYYLFTKY
jgi:hypothetical protein